MAMTRPVRWPVLQDLVGFPHFTVDVAPGAPIPPTITTRTGVRIACELCGLLSNGLILLPSTPTTYICQTCLNTIQKVREMSNQIPSLPLSGFDQALADIDAQIAELDQHFLIIISGVSVKENTPLAVALDGAVTKGNELLAKRTRADYELRLVREYGADVVAEATRTSQLAMLGAIDSRLNGLKSKIEADLGQLDLGQTSIRAYKTRLGSTGMPARVLSSIEALYAMDESEIIATFRKGETEPVADDQDMASISSQLVALEVQYAKVLASTAGDFDLASAASGVIAGGVALLGGDKASTKRQLDEYAAALASQNESKRLSALTRYVLGRVDQLLEVVRIKIVSVKSLSVDIDRRRQVLVGEGIPRTALLAIDAACRSEDQDLIAKWTEAYPLATVAQPDVQ